MAGGKCLHELAQHIGSLPILGKAGPLERLTQFPFDPNANTNVFCGHGGILSYGYTCVYPFYRAGLGKLMVDVESDMAFSMVWNGMHEFKYLILLDKVMQTTIEWE